MKRAGVICVLLVLTSCSFNKRFLAPDKIPEGAKSATIINQAAGDTLKINIGNQYQPTFTDVRGDLVDLPCQIESVVFDGAGGNLLNGWILTPDSGYNGTTILFLHGNAGNIILNYTDVIPLVKAGFNVFLIDYSGFGFSKGAATRKNVLQDATHSLKYLISRTDLNTDRLIIYGQSYGGYLAVIVAAQNAELTDGLVTEGAFTSAKDMAAESAGFVGRLLVKEKYSALKSIRDYHKPVLIIQSREDEVVPFKLGEKLYKNANEPKSFYAIDKCHICGLEFYADSIIYKIEGMEK